MKGETSIVLILFFSTLFIQVKGQGNIYETQEANEFRGIYDPLSAPSAWTNRLNSWAGDVCSVSQSARHEVVKKRVYNRLERFPGEGYEDRNVLLPGSDLFMLTATDLVPLRDRNNVFAKVSAPYEKQLFRLLMEAPRHSLKPADVMQHALNVCGNDYQKACLTAHSVLKEITKTGRKVIQTSYTSYQNYLVLQRDFPYRKSTELARQNAQKDFQDAISTLRLFNQVVSSLKSLRADPGRTPDKMGPWYHIFAVYTLDAVGGGTQARLSYTFEHGAKFFNAFMNEGGYNAEKHTIDQIFGSTQALCTPASVPDNPRVDPSPPPIVQKGQLTCPTTDYLLIEKAVGYRGQAPGVIGKPPTSLYPKAFCIYQAPFENKAPITVEITLGSAELPAFEPGWDAPSLMGYMSRFVKDHVQVTFILPHAFKDKEREGIAIDLINQAKPYARASKR